MLEWIISSSVLIAAVLLLRAILKGRISLRLPYALWGLVLLRLLLPVSFGSTAFSVLNTVPAAARTAPENFVTGGSAVLRTETEEGTYRFPSRYSEFASDREALGPAEGTGELRSAGSHVVLWSAKKLLLAFWIAGIVLMALCLLGSNLHFGRKLRRSRKLLKQETLPVYLTQEADTPCLFGLFRPVIYVTPEAAEDEERLRHVIQHELTHYRHGDPLWSLLRGLCLILHWYNPLVWWAALLSRRDGELACDEATVRHLGEGERAAYGRTLVYMTCPKRPALLVTATTMTGGKRGIRERIALLVKKPRTAVYTLVAVLLLAVVAVGCTFTGGRKETRLYRLSVSASEGGSLPAGLGETLSGDYAPGTELSLAARPDPGYTFDHWELSGGSGYRLENSQDAQTVFTMPEGDVSITAVFRPWEQVEVRFPAGSRRVEVWHDGAYSSAAGGFSVYARPGEELTLRAELAEGEAFTVTWESESGGSFENVHSPETTYTVPPGGDRVTLSLESGEGPAPAPSPFPAAEEPLWPLGYAAPIASRDPAKIGFAWAEDFAASYLALPEGNPRRSLEAAVLRCELTAESLLASPGERMPVYIYNMRLACRAADADAFERSFSGWATSLRRDEYPEYEGWLSFGWYVVLQPREGDYWECTEAGSGGYGGWGWLNYEGDALTDVRSVLQNGSGDRGAYTGEYVLAKLPLMDWRAFDAAADGNEWNALYSLLEAACLTEGRVYGPEETRLWSDVYPGDQVYRDMYMILGLLHSDGAYSEGLEELLRKQYAYDPAVFERCLRENLSADQEQRIRIALAWDSLGFEHPDITLKKGEQYTLEPNVHPAGAGLTHWSSQDPAIASVDESGTVTAWERGVTVITVTLGGVSANCTLRVTD